MTFPKLVRVVSTDGFKHAVTDSATGAPVPGVKSAVLTLQPGEPAQVQLEVWVGQADAAAIAEYVIRHPVSKKLKTVKQITMADGEIWEFPLRAETQGESPFAPARQPQDAAE